MIKKATIPTAFALILLAADTTFMRFVEYLDEYGELDFTHSMFIFGTILGVVYLLLEIAAALWRKPAANWLAALPNIFVLNGFLWYFYVFVGKVLSQSKEDSNYFQAVMIAFSVFFLLINIGREIKTIATNWQKKDAADKEASNQAGE